jgi:hypothetical protein
VANRTRATVEQELSEARGWLSRAWPTEEPQFNMEQAPTPEAREALQRVLQLQNELDSLGG